MRLTISLQSQYSIFLLQIFSLDISRIPPTELKTGYFSYTDDDHAEYPQNYFQLSLHQVDISACSFQHFSTFRSILITVACLYNRVCIEFACVSIDR